ncbi:TM1266 family iron-only hydrogenase system putative regulator [Desulfobaculum bizertense]|uniref:Putative iron-only hydrogenase system regulator n=1 Tax=Desulfobaculum bizertense DSM 18034 TaxID=1121442 RepID=A0A1T4WRJ0_9BACT|nr:TM1266 family iron-only hydrogenase system putative regulator [Desulfobaculum bizertense]UIJ37276.1 iron-only hydrogenase system regulator [Desulfobaculum bizertense]SKA79936.1 putative iron-only hydrogenase system regulator [Desulfobaculum bizertense DSM 18034]
MEKRMGVIGIFISDRKESANAVNDILSEYGDIVVGRLGLPYREKSLSVISLIIEATTDQIGAMTGRLGQIHGVKVKSMLV